MGTSMRVGIFCANNNPRVNEAILEYLRGLGCERVIGVTSQQGPRLPEGVITVMAKANLGNAMRLIGDGDEVEWVLSGPGSSMSSSPTSSTRGGGPSG